MLLLGVSWTQANSQFKSLINKVKDKVNNKLNGSPAKDTTQAKPADSTVVTGSSGTATGAAPSGGAGTAASSGSSVNDGGGAAAQNTPKPPVWPVTGKTVTVTTAVFGVDTSGVRMGAGMGANTSMVFAAFLSSYRYIMTENYM